MSHKARRRERERENLVFPFVVVVVIVVIAVSSAFAFAVVVLPSSFCFSSSCQSWLAKQSLTLPVVRCVKFLFPDKVPKL